MDSTGKAEETVQITYDNGAGGPGGPGGDEAEEKESKDKL